MTPGELRKIVKIMKEFNLSNLKMGDVEIHVGRQDQIHFRPDQKLFSPKTEEKSADPSDPIEHKIEELSSLLKLNDTDLVDQLFPDHTSQLQEESA